VEAALAGDGLERCGREGSEEWECRDFIHERWIKGKRMRLYAGWGVWATRAADSRGGRITDSLAGTTVF